MLGSDKASIFLCRSAVGVFVCCCIIFHYQREAESEGLKMGIAQTAKAEAESLSGFGGQYVKLWGEKGERAKGIRFIVPGPIVQRASKKYDDKKQFVTRIIALDGEIMGQDGLEQVKTATSMLWSFGSKLARQYKEVMGRFESDGAVAVLRLTPTAAQLSMMPWTQVEIVDAMAESEAVGLVQSSDWSEVE